jgi:hypothetical protein
MGQRRTWFRKLLSSLHSSRTILDKFHLAWIFLILVGPKEMNQRGGGDTHGITKRGVKISSGSDESLGGTSAMSLFIM